VAGLINCPGGRFAGGVKPVAGVPSGRITCPRLCGGAVGSLLHILGIAYGARPHFEPVAFLSVVSALAVQAPSPVRVAVWRIGQLGHVYDSVLLRSGHDASIGEVMEDAPRVLDWSVRNLRLDHGIGVPRVISNQQLWTLADQFDRLHFIRVRKRRLLLNGTADRHQSRPGDPAVGSVVLDLAPVGAGDPVSPGRAGGRARPVVGGPIGQVPSSAKLVPGPVLTFHGAITGLNVQAGCVGRAGQGRSRDEGSR